MKVLFIGNSHTYFNDMPAVFAEVMKEGTGTQTEVTMLAYSWKDLEWHMTTEYFTARFNILYGGYDYCIIQQAAHPFPGEETTLNNARRICELCEKAGTRPIVIETWAEKKYPEHQDHLSAANRMVAEKAGAELAPVGSIWSSLVSEHPEIDLFWKDGEHAGVYGDLVITAVLYRMITGEFADPEILGRSARNFVGDMRLDFHHPRVIEDKEKIRTTPDTEKVETICRYVSDYFG